MFVVSVHNLKMSEQIRLSAEYNGRVAIIENLRGERSQTEIIRFFKYSRSIIYDVTIKYLASETFEKGFANPTRKNHLKGNSSNYRKSSRAHFRGPKAVFDEISKNLEGE